MAIFDVYGELSDAQSVAMATGTVASTDVLDFTQADVEFGAGNPLWLNVRMNAALANTDSDATLQVAICHETDTDVDSNSTVIWQTPAIAQASLTAGTWIMRMPLPNNVDESQYVGLLYSVGGSSASTAGSVDAWIDHGSQSSYDTQVTASNI